MESRSSQDVITVLPMCIASSVNQVSSPTNKRDAMEERLLHSVGGSGGGGTRDFPS